MFSRKPRKAEAFAVSAETNEGRDVPQLVRDVTSLSCQLCQLTKLTAAGGALLPQLGFRGKPRKPVLSLEPGLGAEAIFLATYGSNKYMCDPFY